MVSAFSLFAYGLKSTFNDSLHLLNSFSVIRSFLPLSPSSSLRNFVMNSCWISSEALGLSAIFFLRRRLMSSLAESGTILIVSSKQTSASLMFLKVSSSVAPMKGDLK